MACQIIDDDIEIATTVSHADRVAALEARLDKQDRDIIALRSLLMNLGIKKAGVAARKAITEGDLLTAEQEDAILALSGADGLKNLRYINESCIVGTTDGPSSRARLGLKVTRRELTLSKYKCPPEIAIALDDATRRLLFP
jgi:hypothetical protein